MAAKLEFGSWIWEWSATQSRDIQEHLEQEIIGDGWLFRQPAKEQIKILEGAPETFVKSILKRIKPEAAIELGMNPFR